MTASIESIADGIVASRIAQDWLYSPSPAPGVLDFQVDGLHFRIVVIDDALSIDGIAVFRDQGDISEEEAAQILHAQELAAEAEYPTPEQEPLGAHTPTQEELVDVESFKAASDFEGYDAAQAAGREEV